MANAFLTADNIAAVAAALAGEDLGLANLIHKDLAAEFVPGGGNIVSIRVPGAVAANTRLASDKSTPLTNDEVSEQSIPVTLVDHVYSSVLLSEADLSLEIADYSKQVLVPQVSSIVKSIEAQVAAAMSATPETLTVAYAAATPAKTFTAMRGILRGNGVSADEKLVAVCGTGVYGDLLDGPAGTWDANGNVRGVEVHENSRLAAGEIVMFIKTAFAAVVRAPVVPQGATGKSINSDGFALRVVMDYDSSVAADRSLVSALVEVTPLPLPVDGEAGVVNLVANGGVVRVLTTTIPA